MSGERRLRIGPAAASAAALDAPLAWLRRGGIVIVPTDTLYGLAVDPRSAAAVADVFDLKGRDDQAALPLLAASGAQVEETIGRLGPVGRDLAARFWPGPLALILDAPEEVAPAVHAGTGGVAVRVPAHEIARRLALEFGWPLTATSANRSGSPAVRSVAALAALAADRRVFTIDAGLVPGGAASTIVDVRPTPPRLVREGAVAWSRVLESMHA
ncbi:MAG TPA: L-threonylcarbamoyladenylate synthase [Vicinamibacterales bacterium]|nr:L-threonylcarbamoyladenylate synthase [Vicinamibacterales bacterium]